MEWKIGMNQSPGYVDCEDVSHKSTIETAALPAKTHNCMLGVETGCNTGDTIIGMPKNTVAIKKRQPVTQKDAAGFCGVDVRTIQNGEAGKSTPSGYPGRTKKASLIILGAAFQQDKALTANARAMNYPATMDLRAVFTDRYTAMDHIEVLYAILEHGIGPTQEIQFSLDGSLMLVKAPNYDRIFGVAPKDRSVPGVSLGNSEVGTLAFCLEAYFYRLICSNGLIAMAATASSRFRHTSRRALTEFPELLGQVVAESGRSQNQFMISTQTPVANPQETFTRLNSQFLLTKKMAEAVDRAWPMEEGKTMFNVLNTYTRAAQDAALDVKESMQLERVGGQILSMVRQ